MGILDMVEELYFLKKIMSITLDQLLIELPDIMTKIGVMKIDIEGFEYKAIRGGHKFFSKYPPCFIYIELIEQYLRANGGSIMETFDLFQSYGYNKIMSNGVGWQNEFKWNNETYIEVFVIHDDCIEYWETQKVHDTNMIDLNGELSLS